MLSLGTRLEINRKRIFVIYKNHFAKYYTTKSDRNFEEDL